MYYVYQVAKQVRTMPVRGCDAEKGFDAEKCDLGNCAFPPSPHPNFSDYVKMQPKMITKSMKII